MGAATATTILSSGRLSIRAFRRCSYSLEGIPGVSSFGWTIKDIPSAAKRRLLVCRTDEDVDVIGRQVGRMETVSVKKVIVRRRLRICDMVHPVVVEFYSAQKVSGDT